jgi:glutaminase
VKATDKDGRTALSIAAAQGSLNAVKYLLSQGADPALRDARYHNTLYDAKKENRDAVVNYLETRLNKNIIINYCSEF